MNVILLYTSISLLQCINVKRCVSNLCCGSYKEEMADIEMSGKWSETEGKEKTTEVPITDLTNYQEIKDKLLNIEIKDFETASQEIKYVIMMTIFDIITLCSKDHQLSKDLSHDIFLLSVELNDRHCTKSFRIYDKQFNNDLKNYFDIVKTNIENFKLGQVIKIKEFLNVEEEHNLLDHESCLYNTYNFAFFDNLHSKLCKRNQIDLQDQIYENFLFWCLTMFKIGSSFNL